MTNIISGANASTGVNLSAPTSGTTVDSHLRTLVENNSLTGNDKGDITIAVPTTNTKNNLTSMGVYSDGFVGSLWRMRAGAGGSDINDARLFAYRGSFSEFYDLPAGYDTFAISPEIKTHILRGPGVNRTKAVNTIPAKGPEINNTDDYNIIGSNFDDVLAGADGNDTLTGGLGSDDLTGNLGADVFAYNLADVADASTKTDTIQDFSQIEMDKIGLGTGLTFGANVFADTTSQSSDTLIRLNNAATGDIIATVLGVSLGAGDFITI